MAGTLKGIVRCSGTRLCHVIQQLCSATCLNSVAATGGLKVPEMAPGLDAVTAENNGIGLVYVGY